MRPALLVINAGSSSLKFQVFETCENGLARDEDRPGRVFRGLFEGLGGSPHLVIRDRDGLIVAEDRPAVTRGCYGHEEALLTVAEWLRSHRGGYRLAAVGHRVVHGGLAHAAPVRVDETVLDGLERLVPLAPLHQPHNLEPIRIVRQQFPDLPQVACFDTAFHRAQPEIAQLFAIPGEMTR